MEEVAFQLQRGAASDSAAPSKGRATEQEQIGRDLAALADEDIHELRVRWRRLFRTKAPEHLSRSLLSRILGYRLQVDVFGDLDRESKRFLDRIAKQLAAGSSKPVPPVAETLSFKPGTILIREYEGVLHRAVVAEDGYAWNSTTYRSLSEVARAITGTRWNGPRFFGLRNSKLPVPTEEGT